MLLRLNRDLEFDSGADQIRHTFANGLQFLPLLCIQNCAAHQRQWYGKGPRKLATHFTGYGEFRAYANETKVSKFDFIGYKNLPKLLLQFCEVFYSWLFLDIAWQSRDDGVLCDFTWLDPSFLNLVYFGMLNIGVARGKGGAGGPPPPQLKYHQW